MRTTFEKTNKTCEHLDVDFYGFYEPKLNVSEQEEAKEREEGEWAQTFRDVFARHGKPDGIGSYNGNSCCCPCRTSITSFFFHHLLSVFFLNITRLLRYLRSLKTTAESKVTDISQMTKMTQITLVTKKTDISKKTKITKLTVITCTTQITHVSIA